MNIVAMIGNVASEPVRRTDYAVSFSLAVSFRDEAETFRVLTTGRQAEIVEQYLQVGRRVSVEGRVTPDGYISASRIELLGRATAAGTPLELDVPAPG